MSKQDEVVVAGGVSCDMSIEEHLEILVTAMTMFGLGVACETEIKALLVLAEVGKRLGKFADFDPGPMAEKIITAREEYLNNKEKIEKARRDHLLFPAPDNGKVH